MNEPRPIGPSWLAVALGVALLVYLPARQGPFFSDDLLLIAWNDYVTAPDASGLLELFDPFGEPRIRIANYSPLLQLVHTAQWSVFGDGVLGYHICNMALHALVSWLFARLLLLAGLARPAALGLAGIFLVHPANVEAVAWISQLKTPLSTALAIGALLLEPRRQVLALLCYAAAMLVKPTAIFALPVAAVALWVSGRPEHGRRRVAWLLGWALFTGAFLVAELAAFSWGALGIEPVHPDPVVRLRSAVANVARYARIALSSYGASAYHEPPTALSWLDPWWLAGLALLLAMLWRTALTLRRRRLEAAYWCWVLAAFAPVSQILPFDYPMGDRYLYTILPGLLGALGLALAPALSARLAGVPVRVAALALALGVVFGIHSASRAALWGTTDRLLADAARNYPDGTTARVEAAKRAGRAGDTAGSARELRAAFERGFRSYELVYGDASFVAVRDSSEVGEVLRAMAGWWIENLAPTEALTQGQLHQRGRAHLFRREYGEAVLDYERALAAGGPAAAAIRLELDYARTQAGR